jgi:DNA invertase Pin-like site-specific DNA recombinase
MLFEEKLSGAKRNRPKLEKLIEQLRKGDVLVVTRLDRLARSTSELLRIAERLTEKSAGLQSLDEPWADTTSPSGRMVMTIFAASPSSNAPSSSAEQTTAGWPRKRAA